jgi:hypothetical protein
VSLCRLAFRHSECVSKRVFVPLAHSRHACLPLLYQRLLLYETLLIAFATCCLVGLASGVSEAAASSATPDTSGASRSVEATEKQEPGPGSSPFLTFAAIERAWKMGYVDSITTFFPEEKITLRLEKNVPEAAAFSQKQASYMLRDSFRYRITESFEFLEFKYNKNKHKPPFGKAQWTFRREPAGKTIVAKVQVTLRKEGERWLISGIRIQD